MSDAWHTHRSRLQGAFATPFAAEWDAGRASLCAPLVYVSNAPPSAPVPLSSTTPNDEPEPEHRGAQSFRPL